MSTLTHDIQASQPRSGAASTVRGRLVALIFAVLATFVAVAFTAPEIPQDQAVHNSTSPEMIEDWRGNSASIRPRD